MKVGSDTGGGGTVLTAQIHFMCATFQSRYSSPADHAVEAHDRYAMTELHDLVRLAPTQLSTCQTFQVEASPIRRQRIIEFNCMALVGRVAQNAGLFAVFHFPAGDFRSRNGNSPRFEPIDHETGLSSTMPSLVEAMISSSVPSLPGRMLTLVMRLDRSPVECGCTCSAAAFSEDGAAGFLVCFVDHGARTEGVYENTLIDQQIIAFG